MISATFALSFLVTLGVLVQIVRAQHAAPRRPPPTTHGGAPPPERYPASRSLAVLMADIEGYAAVTAASSRQQLVSLLDDARRLVLAAAAARRVRMRVGVASGEVTLHRDDVFGDAVNLAARLQAAASTGQVWFSESTYHAMVRSEVPHEEVGVVELKNVGPARVFRTRAAP